MLFEASTLVMVKEGEICLQEAEEVAWVLWNQSCLSLDPDRGSYHLYDLESPGRTSSTVLPACVCFQS